MEVPSCWGPFLRVWEINSFLIKKPLLSVLAFRGLSGQKELGKLNLIVICKSVWSTGLTFAIRF